MQPFPSLSSGVTGELWLKQTPHAVQISGLIKGLSAGKHGFHVHMTGDVGDECKAAGGHFNPHGVRGKSQ